MLENSGKVITQEKEPTKRKPKSKKRKPSVTKRKPRVKESWFVCMLRNIYKEPKSTTLGLLYIFMMTSMLVYGKITEAVYIGVIPIAIPLLLKGKSSDDD